MTGDTIRMQVYVYDPSQPPASGLSQNVKITVENQRHMSVIDPDDGSSFIQLVVAEAGLLGLDGSEDSQIIKFMDKVILACNLTMKRAAFSNKVIDPSRPVMDMDDPPASTAKVEKTPTGFNVNIVEPIRIRDSVSVSVGFDDALDEAQFVDMLRKIQIVHADINGTIANHNLKKALESYQSATMNAGKHNTFRNLYSALEDAVNFDGSHVNDKDFDNEVCSILADNQLPIGDLRRFNNRLKHPDNDMQRKLYEEAIGQATENIRKLRPIVTKVLLHRLPSV